MQFDHTGNCIISGYAPTAAKAESEVKAAAQISEAPASPEGKKSSKKSSILKKMAVSTLLQKQLVRDMVLVIKKRSRRTMAIAAGGAVFLAGISALSSYCTVGVDYYCDGELLCTVAAADNAADIIKAAAAKADSLGVEEPVISTIAKLTFKNDLTDVDEAIDRILSESPELCRGYVVSVNGTELFTALDKNTITAVLDDYINKYRINESARLSHEIDIKEQIVRKDNVTPTDSIIATLEKGNFLTVVNTVDTSEEQAVPFDVEEIPDDTMYMGDTAVDVPGADGVITTVAENVYSNGELLSTSILSCETTTEPVTQVTRVGTIPRNALADGFSYPVSGHLSSGFGPRWGKTHRGIDLAVATGTPVGAGAAGTVITAKYNSSYGNYVQIDHGYGIVTTYAHLDSYIVSVGQTVNRGEVIGYSGSTGNSTGPHVHFEVIIDGEYTDPLNYLI